MIKAVLFDFNATLAIADPAFETFDERLHERGFGRFASRALFDALVADLHDGVEHIDASVDEQTYLAWARSHAVGGARLAGADQTEAIRIAGIYDEWNTEYFTRMVPYDESHEVLRTLRDAGITIAICSNWDWNIDVSLAAAGILDFVDHVFLSSRIGIRKPHPRFFEHCLQEVGVNAGEALFVGDNWDVDIEGAVNAGMTAIWISRDGTPPPRDVERVLVAASLRPVVELAGA